MISFISISGSSMLPTLKDGDYILAMKIPKRFYKKSDIVVVDHARYGRIIKRISCIDINDGIFLKGDGSDTLSSDKMGRIERASIIGKMIWHIPK